MPVAQPDRVFGYEPKGRGFESLQARQQARPACKSRSSLCGERFVVRIFNGYLFCQCAQKKAEQPSGEDAGGKEIAS